MITNHKNHTATHPTAGRDGRLGTGWRLAAAALMLVLAASPAVSVAGEPDLEREGETDPAEVLPGDSTQAPDFDPGGPSTELPEDPSAPIETPSLGEDPDLGVLEQEPVTDPVAPVESQPEPLAEPRPIAQEPPGVAPVPPAGEPVAAQPPGAEAIPPTLGQQAEPERQAERRAAPERLRSHTRKAPRDREDGDRAPAPPAAAPAPAPVATTTSSLGAVDDQATPAAVVPVVTAADAPPGGKVHVVRAGECLWTIARDLLGRGATDERIARLVARLWALNAERIGTGDPNRIMPGQRLVLP